MPRAAPCGPRTWSATSASRSLPPWSCSTWPRSRRPAGPPVADAAELLVRARRIGAGRVTTWLELTLGTNTALGGDLAGGAAHFRDALREAEDANHVHGTRFAVMGLAGIDVLAGDLVAAARLQAAVEPHLETLRSTLPAHYFAHHQGLVDATRRDLDASLHRRATATGAAWSWPETRAAAIEVAERLTAVLPPSVEPAATGPGPEPSASPISSPALTARELEVRAAVADGDTNNEIARRLHLAPKTVMHHTSRIYRKLGVRGRAEAATHALRHGLVDRPDTLSP
ncbi:hypothetical protein BH23ACT2_BH23ACT2_18900 [soil metagenome]